MGNLGVLVPILALLIPIVAIIMTNWRRVQERKLELMERGSAEIGGATQAKIDRLEARVAVLERIATDKQISLADEIDRLGN
jgi:hypothetical protein